MSCRAQARLESGVNLPRILEHDVCDIWRIPGPEEETIDSSRFDSLDLLPRAACQLSGALALSGPEPYVSTLDFADPTGQPTLGGVQDWS
jgi:hypothetical protein